MTDENKLINILLDNAPRFVNKFIKNPDKFIFFQTYSTRFRQIQQNFRQIHQEIP